MKPYLLENWRIGSGGNRKGANVSVGEIYGDHTISGGVIDWLDDQFKPCPRKNARYCLIERWNYGMAATRHIPDVFCVAMD